MTENSVDDLSERISTCRNLALELLREMPDMKDEIEMQLNLEETNQETNKTEATTMNQKSTADCAKVEKSKSSLDELKRFRIIRKRELEDAEVQLPPAKLVQLDKHIATKEHKSIIEIRLTNEDKKSTIADETEERIRYLKEQAIIELDKLRCEEKTEKIKADEESLKKPTKLMDVETKKEQVMCGAVETTAKTEINLNTPADQTIETLNRNQDEKFVAEIKLNTNHSAILDKELKTCLKEHLDKAQLSTVDKLATEIDNKPDEMQTAKVTTDVSENWEKGLPIGNVGDEIHKNLAEKKVDEQKNSCEHTDVEKIHQKTNIHTTPDIQLLNQIDEKFEQINSTKVAEAIMTTLTETILTTVAEVINPEHKSETDPSELTNMTVVNVQPIADDSISTKNDNQNVIEYADAVVDAYRNTPEMSAFSGTQSTIGTLSLDMPETHDESSNLSAAEYELPPEQLSVEEEALDQKLRASRETFLQHLPCFKLHEPTETINDNRTDSSKIEVSKCALTKSNVPKCRECRRRRNGASPNDVYCRFISFRRLQYNADNQLIVAGFPNPYTEPTRDDLNTWQPDEHTEPTAGYMDIQVCRYILLHAGDQFCYLWRQEAEALKLHENPNSTIAWKKVVKGIREICDVCDTTLFNYHWTCDRCGFGVCLDCFKDRKEQRTCRKTRDKPQRGRDDFHWLLCTAPLQTGSQHQKHELRELMLTQIIAGDSLNVLGRLLHDVRTIWQVPQVCGCLLSKQQLPPDDELSELVQDMIKESQLKQQTSASSLATEETLRQQARMEKLHSKKLEFARAKGIDYVPGRVWTKQTLGKDPITTAFDNFKHINFLRKGLAGLRRFLPPRAMTLAHSRLLAPGVPHEWLCDGKLLRLTNAMHPDNRILYQEVWKCGQPVMISEVARSLNLDLWRPEAFCRDFGDKPNDLINCLNGNLVPNQPMRHFWEGFQCIQKRLLDANGKPMLLKLKDWPPGDDFAEILPTRFADLMRGLPMPEYTLRTGNLNIASCLPKMFVPPDLGPKMYNAYGSALHPDKGTTNLHLDISDAVNIMVYVGIPQDSDSRSQLSATQRAIAMGGCDYITRARSQSSEVLPGALWHIFPARDADKIRDLLNRVTLEKGFRLEPDHDPIHDQNWYLDDKLRARLFNEYGVEGYPIVQCLGDAVFIPAGAPHQVQNLHNCIKVAEDFVSPENITHCYHLTHEFRRLSHSHTNHEDKLQIKNIIYHAIKDCCTILVRALQQRIDEELEQQMQQQAKLEMRADNAVEFISNLTSDKPAANVE